MVIACGNELGLKGVVDGRSDEGHFRIKVQDPKGTHVRLLGYWWLIEAINGKLK